MACLSNLISNRFLKNVGKEITEARTVLKNNSKKQYRFGELPGPRALRKKQYDYFSRLIDLRGSFDDVDVNDSLDMLYCVQDGPIAWIACRTKDLVDQAMLDTLHTNGDVPFYTGKQYFQSRLFYVAMYDLTFRIPPPTTN